MNKEQIKLKLRLFLQKSENNRLWDTDDLRIALTEYKNSLAIRGVFEEVIWHDAIREVILERLARK